MGKFLGIADQCLRIGIKVVVRDRVRIRIRIKFF